MKRHGGSLHDHLHFLAALPGVGLWLGRCQFDNVGRFFVEGLRRRRGGLLQQGVFPYLLTEVASELRLDLQT